MVNIREWIELLGQLYNPFGYILAFGGSLAENTALLGLMLPGGSLALLSAFYARQGTLDLGWGIFGILVVLFVTWRFLRQRIRRRLRQARRRDRVHTITYSSLEVRGVEHVREK